MIDRDPQRILIRLGQRIVDLRWAHAQHRAERFVRTVRGEALETVFPRVEVETFERFERIVRRHVHRLRDRRVHVRLHGGHHVEMVAC